MSGRLSHVHCLVATKCADGDHAASKQLLMRRFQDLHAVSETEICAFPAAFRRSIVVTRGVNYRGAFLNRLGTQRNRPARPLTARRNGVDHLWRRNPPTFGPNAARSST